MFKPPKTIILGPEEDHAEMLAFHELGHALSGKYDFDTEIERLKIESTAWAEGKHAYESFKKAHKELNLPAWDEDFAEDQLDTYRDWLHAKSRCKSCGLTRYQDKSGAWHCPFCDEFKVKKPASS